MKPEEMKRCLARLNMSPGSLQKLIGCRELKKITPAQARCVRALVLHDDVRSLIFKWRSAFPDLEFIAIKALENDKR